MRIVTNLHLTSGRDPAGSIPVSTSLRTRPLVPGLPRPDPQTRPPAAALTILLVWLLAIGLCLAFWTGIVALLVSLA
jgi:hypothetical protein